MARLAGRIRNMGQSAARHRDKRIAALIKGVTTRIIGLTGARTVLNLASSMGPGGRD
jgi:hypothetical protein